MAFRCRVVDEYNNVEKWIKPEMAERMVRLGQAKKIPGSSSYRLQRSGVSNLPCRTAISSGGIKAAIGMSQDYTTHHRSYVSGYKRIYREDKFFFDLARLENIKVATKA